MTYEELGSCFQDICIEQRINLGLCQVGETCGCENVNIMNIINTFDAVNEYTYSVGAAGDE